MPTLPRLAKVFSAGDRRRGQLLVVGAIRESQQCDQTVDHFLMDSQVCFGFETVPKEIVHLTIGLQMYDKFFWF